MPKGYQPVTEGGVALAVPRSGPPRPTTSRQAHGPEGQRAEHHDQEDPRRQPGGAAAAEQNLNIKDFTDYTQVQLHQVDYRYPAADWEYTYTNSNEVTVHAVIRYLEVGERAYAIMFASPDFDWNESRAPVRQALWSTFRAA